MSSASHTTAADGRGVAPLGAVLAVTFLASLGTGVFWNAIGFVAKHAYGFSQQRTLVLYLVMGAVYTIGAARAGPVTRWCERWISPRGLLAVVIAAQGVLCAGPIVFEGAWALWVTIIGVSYASSLVWPLMESYVVAGRHGPDMRSSIGWFNLTWMSAVSLPLLLMPPILEHHAEWAVGALTFANFAALGPLLLFPRRHAAHDDALSAVHVPGEYGMLMRSARVLLPLSYVLMAAMSPVLPYRFETLGANVMFETPATATWMIARVVAMFVLWRSAFWHGRWGTLVLGGVSMAGGFGLIVLAPSVPLMLVGFTGFGVGLGIIYHSALYYGMAVGRAEVDAGGAHEALIGAGYAVGPAAALLGTALGGPVAIVAICWGVLGLAAAPAVRPYQSARRARRVAAP